MKALLLSLLALLLVTSVAFESLPFAKADTVYLTNGAVIHGKVSADPNRADASRVRFRNGGHLVLENSAIKKTVKNELGAFRSGSQEAVAVPAANTDSKTVRVTLKSEMTAFYGRGSYVGRPRDSDDDTVVVLGLPGGGELRIPKADIESTVGVDLREAGLAPAIEPEGGRITTTHEITLDNGRVIVGDLEPGDDNTQLKIRVGQLGLLRFDRSAVKNIQRINGSYQLPEVDDAPGTPEKTYNIPPELIEELKIDLRREILRELIEGVIDDKIDDSLDAKLGSADLGGSVRLPVEALPADAILEVQHLVRELGRQRSRNRVRAEAGLKDFGPGVLEYLDQASVHPFELTRRAVQRIVHEVGDFRGAPLSIDGLNDKDEHVRRLAHQALKRILDANISYSATATEEQRLAAQTGYRELWLDIVREEARAELAAKTRKLLDE